jgi:serine/threonine protein kinase
MPDERGKLFARHAVELGYVTREQLDDAIATQKTVAGLGLAETLSHVLVTKRVITHEQHQDIENRIALQSGEARIVGGYEVIEKLGQGCMGAVYKARRVDDRLLVALKILPPSLATPTHVARFRREADVVRSLEHPNIVGYVEFGHDSKRDCDYCALELVEGEDVASMIARLGRVGQGDTVVIARQIADALQHAHNHGLVHRDIKPANIMLLPSGIAKLLDLGLARPAADPSARHTQTGMFVGSPDYASPEQSRGEQDIDTRSDIYSLGASMYHMVCGQPPFTGGTALEVLRRHQTVAPVPPVREQPDAAPEADAAEGAFELAETFRREHPDSRAQWPQRYQDVIDRFPDSVQAARARLKLVEFDGAKRPAATARIEERAFLQPAVNVSVWIAGECPEKHTFVQHPWYDDVDYDLFSANDWLSHYSTETPGKVVYTFEVKTAASYVFHIRANPMSATMQWQLDWGEWTTIDFGSVPRDAYFNVAAEAAGRRAVPRRERLQALQTDALGRGRAHLCAHGRSRGHARPSI